MPRMHSGRHTIYQSNHDESGQCELVDDSTMSCLRSSMSHFSFAISVSDSASAVHLLFDVLEYNCTLKPFLASKQLTVIGPTAAGGHYSMSKHRRISLILRGI
jgi:hypothetical protein